MLNTNGDVIKTIMGAQTTTLLFAYMGSYHGHDGIFTAIDIPNSKATAAGILHTFCSRIGACFGVNFDIFDKWSHVWQRHAGRDRVEEAMEPLEEILVALSSIKFT